MRIVALIALALVAVPSPALAHDIPNAAVVQAFLKPEGNRLRFLVRVPLEAMTDIDVPRRANGFLDLAHADAALRTAAIVWIGRQVALYEEETRLGEPALVAVRASLPSDLSFREYDTARAHLTGPPLGDDVELYWEQAFLDAWFEYPIVSDRSRLAMNPGLRTLAQRVTISLRLLTPDSRDRAFELHDDPGLVRLDPRWHQAAGRFVASGFMHILDGADHLLFLVCLVIPLRRMRTLVAVVTSFTAAHSVTLIASAYGVAPDGLWFPPLVETLIAASIVYMALENIVAANIMRRWAITFAFGLVHGLGFSFALRDTLQFAGSHLLTALLAFNLGVEAGQLLVLLLVVPALNMLFRYVVAERMGTIVLSAIVAHTAWHWMSDRGARLLLFPAPVMDAAFMLAAVRWTIGLVIAGGVIWIARILWPSRSPAKAGHYVPNVADVPPDSRRVRL
jgi:hypothetical protein